MPLPSDYINPGRLRGPLEDSPEIIRRARFLQQVGLGFEPLMSEQSVVVDTICELLPLIDEPMILDRLAPGDRAVVVDMLGELPRTHEITRFLNQ